MRDYLDVGLMYADHAIGILGPAWPDADEADIDDLPCISDAEYAAAATLALTPLPIDVTNSASRAAALQFATS